MPTKSKQETFDKVVVHMRKQGKRAIYPIHNACAYRTADKLSCPAGYLIPDDLYDPAFEGKAVTLAGCVALANPSRVLDVLGYDIPLVMQFQQTHDLYEPHAWEEQFAAIAKQHGLMYMPPEVDISTIPPGQKVKITRTRNFCGRPGDVMRRLDNECRVWANPIQSHFLRILTGVETGAERYPGWVWVSSPGDTFGTLIND